MLSFDFTATEPEPAQSLTNDAVSSLCVCVGRGGGCECVTCKVCDKALIQEM